VHTHVVESTAMTSTPIAGSPDVLREQPVLEAPVQTDPVPQSVIDHANGKEPPVQIRDVLGNVCN